MGVFTTQGYRGKLVDKLTGTILDQFADEDIKVSNNILELFDLGEIPGTYTQQITLPGTKKNNAFFEQYYDISVWEPDIFNTNQVVEAYLDFDAFYLVNGYLQLNKVNVIENKFVDSYEVTLFGIISNFSIDARSSFLTDISSLSAYNHTSSYANITSSWGRGLFNGDIVYPMIEYGNDATAQPNFYFSNVDFLGIDDFESGVTVSNYKPAIRIKKVWDAIFNEFGYTYTGSFWSQPFLNDVYLPLNNDKQVAVYNPSIATYYQAKLTNVSASATTLVANVSQSFPVNSELYDYNNAAVLTGGSFTYTTAITTRLDIKLNLAFQVISGSFGTGSGMPGFFINYMSGSTLVNGQSLARLNTNLGVIAQSRTSVVTETFNIKDYIFQTPELDPGTYTFQIYQTPQFVNNYQVKLNPDVNNQSSFEIFRVRQAADYKVLDVPSNMPFGTSGVKVIDFIRAIQKKFNLIIYPDKLNPNQFVVETFNNWYKQGTIKDFNRYINIKDKIEFTPANQLGYNKVRFSDADDTDYVTTLFKRTNNRVYGESNFYDSGSYYSQGTLDVTSDAIASGPLTLVPGSVYSGAAAIVINCTTYEIYNSGTESYNITYTQCGGSVQTFTLPAKATTYICSQTIPTANNNFFVIIEETGDCSPAPASGSVFGIPMWIPYYIADDKYTPARVLPRLLFYNGLRDTQEYWFEGYFTNSSSVDRFQLAEYPYFDNYSTGSLNGTASLYPQLDSLSLLYNNEQTVWGTTPTSSLVSEYWDTYLELLYNPRTRLVDATAVIPLADYFNIELNDIAEFRSNYYHLRAINDYNLTTGECNIQMLGPIIPDTISSILSGSWSPVEDLCAFTYTASFVPYFVSFSAGYNATTPLTACSATSSFYYAESGSEFSIGALLFADSGAVSFAPNGYYASGSTIYTVTGSNGTLTYPTYSCTPGNLNILWNPSGANISASLVAINPNMKVSVTSSIRNTIITSSFSNYTASLSSSLTIYEGDIVNVNITGAQGSSSIAEVDQYGWKAVSLIATTGSTTVFNIPVNVTSSKWYLPTGPTTGSSSFTVIGGSSNYSLTGSLYNGVSPLCCVNNYILTNECVGNILNYTNCAGANVNLGRKGQYFLSYCVRWNQNGVFDCGSIIYNYGYVYYCQDC